MGDGQYQVTKLYSYTYIFTSRSISLSASVYLQISACISIDIHLWAGNTSLRRWQLSWYQTWEFANCTKYWENSRQEELWVQRPWSEDELSKFQRVWPSKCGWSWWVKGRMVGNKARSCRTLQAMQRTCDFMLSWWEALKSFNQRTNIVKPLLLKDCFGVRWRVEIRSNKSKSGKTRQKVLPEALGEKRGWTKQRQCSGLLQNDPQ